MSCYAYSRTNKTVFVYKKKNGNHFIRSALLKSVCKGNTHSVCIFHINLFQNQFPMQKKKKKIRVVDPMGIRDIENTIGKNEGKVKRIKKTFLLKGKASE